MTTDRENLEKVAHTYRELHVLQEKQRATTALLIRACLRRLKSPRATERNEAIVGLTDLAVMLETPRGP